MNITKHRMKDGTGPNADLPFGLKIRARAAAERVDGHHTGRVLVYTSNPPLSLLAHEVDRVLRDSKAHCPAWHCCGRVGHAVRFLEPLWRHLHPGAKLAAVALSGVGYGVPVEA